MSHDPEALTNLLARAEEHDALQALARKLRRHLTRIATLHRALDPDDGTTTSPAPPESLQAEIDRREMEAQVVAAKITQRLVALEA